MEDLVPEPVLFNIWKHHFFYLIQEIRRSSGSIHHEMLKSSMKMIGNSTTDLYTGRMTIGEISDYCKRYLKKRHLYKKDIYLDWISEHPENYREIELPDSSIWILRIGIEIGRHIHIHPGRNVPLTIRVKANILKTAYLANLYALHDGDSPMNVHLINAVRKDILDLSPIKFITMNHDLGRMIFLFGDELGIVT